MAFCRRNRGSVEERTPFPHGGFARRLWLAACTMRVVVPETTFHRGVIMSVMSHDELLAELLALPVPERARIVEEVLASLETAKLREEMLRRIREVNELPELGIPHEEVMRQLREDEANDPAGNDE